MLFDSSFRKELQRSFSATVIVLLTIVMTVMLIRTLGRASAGRVDPSEVLLVLGFTMLGYLATIITLSLFVAITATLSRMYTHSEMVVWFASGQGLSAFVRPLLRFALPVVSLVALLALLAWPWSNQQVEALRDRYQGRQDVERIAPGRFIESADGQRVFFIDKQAGDSGSGSNIFISASDHGKEAVVSASRGRIAADAKGRMLVLDDGVRLESESKTGTMRLSTFREYTNRIDEPLPARRPGISPKTMSTFALLAEPTQEHLAELSWRLGLVLAAFNCVFIALAVTRVNPRAGRNSSLIFIVFAFATYYNLVSIGQGWVRGGQIGILPMLLLLHGGILLAALGWLAWRQRSWRLRRVVRGRATTPA